MKYKSININKIYLRSFVLVFFIIASFFVYGKAFAGLCDFDPTAWGGGGYTGGEDEIAERDFCSQGSSPADCASKGTGSGCYWNDGGGGGGDSGPTCATGWSAEDLVYDGWVGSGPVWCNNTPYGQCNPGPGGQTGGHDPSAKGSTGLCCRGSDNLGWVRRCNGTPLPEIERCTIISFDAVPPSPPYNTSTTLRLSLLNTSFTWTITKLQGPTIFNTTSGTGSSGVTATGNLTERHIYRLTCGSDTRDLNVDPQSQAGTIYQYRCNGGSCIYVGNDGTGNTNDPTCNNSCSTPPPPPPPPPPATCDENASVSVIQPLPPTMNPGQTYSFTMHVANTGSSWWYHGDVYQFIKTSGNMVITPSIGWLPPSRVIGGDYVDWTFNVTAPTTPGNYFVQMQMLHTTYATGNYLNSGGSVCAPPPTSDAYFGNVGIVSSVVTPASLPKLLTVNKVGTGTGTITSVPVGISCGATCSYSFAYNTPVTLTATPAGSTFAGCSGDTDCSDCSVTMTAPKNCTASFNLNPPPTPTGFFVAPSSCGNNWLNLRWSVSRGATSYQVYRGGTLVTLAGYSCDAFSCSGSDTGLTLEATYLYSITASNAGGTSASASASGTVAPACVCSNPLTDTQTLSCDAGYSGLITQTRNKTAYPGCAWGGWTTTSNTCVLNSCPAPTSQTRSVACGAAYYSGNKTEIQTKGPPPGCGWSAWTLQSDASCVPFVYCSNGSPAPGNNLANCAASSALPIVDFPTATNITSTGATLGATVISLGIPAFIIQRGVCWGTSPFPATFCQNSALAQTVPGVFTTVVNTNINPSTKYYYRGYAVNATGPAYSGDRWFTTVVGPVTHTLLITHPIVGGSVKSTNVAGIECGNACSYSYNSGDTVNLQATPSSSYWEFSTWSGGGCSGALPTCSIIVSGDVTVTATFKPRLFNYREF